eukprot:1387633-Rhodomonas_salina.2
MISTKRGRGNRAATNFERSARLGTWGRVYRDAVVGLAQSLGPVETAGAVGAVGPVSVTAPVSISISISICGRVWSGAIGRGVGEATERRDGERGREGPGGFPSEHAG